MKQFTSKLPSSSSVLYSFELFKFHDFFHDLFQFSMALVLAFTFKNFQNYSCFGDIFTYVIQLNRHKLWCPTKCASFTLFNYVSLSYFVLALTSTVTNLPNIILQFSMNFHDRQLNSMTFQAWKIKFLNFMTFQVFHDLYEPCHHWDHHKPQFPIPETRGMGTSFWHNDFGESL